MRWEGGKKSENLEDRRNMAPATVAAGGIGVVLVMLVAAFMGIDPKQAQKFIGNGAGNGGNRGGGQVKRELTAEEVKSGEFFKTVLNYTEEVWDEQFRKAGEKYVQPKMVLFSEQVATGCGNAPSAVGPFYCPADRTVYLDPTFFEELKQKMGGSDAEFSQAYVVAHEIGHHVQNLLGYSSIVDEVRQTKSKTEANHASVRLELQADYLAGVWAHYGQQKFKFVESGDIAAAMKSANAIGDDRLQKNSRGFTSPESYTHGTSEQRIKWFRLGLQTGDLGALKELFSLPYNEL